VRIYRVPGWAREQIVDVAFAWSISVPSGVRLQLLTDSTAVELEFHLARARLLGQDGTLPAFDLAVDGDLRGPFVSDSGDVYAVDPRDVTRLEYTPGEPARMVWDGLGRGTKLIEIWLPHNAAFELRALRIDDGASCAAPEVDAPRWLHYGSSISHCVEALRPTGVWPVIAARRAGVELMSFGFAGQAQLDQLVARTMRDLPADFLSLKVGINVVNGDTMRERTFVPAVHGFLDTLRDGHPDTPVLLISPIICPAVEADPGPTLVDEHGRVYVVERPAETAAGALTLRRIRELLAAVVQQRSDRNLHYLDGLELFGESDVADLPDGLHPNADGYQRMGDRFYSAAFAPGGVFAGRAEIAAG
jgi:hypothetical protein